MIKLFLSTLICLLCYSSFASTTTFKWGIREDLVYFKKQAAAFKKDIEKATNKRVQIQIDSYSEAKEKSQVATTFIENKTYDIAQDLTGNLENFNDQLMIWNLPFLFSSYEHLETFMSTMGAESLKKMETASLLPVDYSYSGGFVVITGKKMNNFSEIVSSKQPLIIEEKYSTYRNYLQQEKISCSDERGKIDAPYTEHILAVADEVASSNQVVGTHINVTQHRVIARIVFVGKATLAKLSVKDRDLFTTMLKKYLRLEREDSISGQKIVLQLLENRGAIINHWQTQDRVNGQKFFQKQYDSFENLHPGYVLKIRSLDRALAKSH